MQKGFILPLNRITRNVLEQMIKTEREVEVGKKYDEKMSYGKLSKQDLDTIRFLLVKKISKSTIAIVFGVSENTIESIRCGLTHSKKETVFLKRLADISSADSKKLDKWFEQNKEFVLNKVECSELDVEYKILLINKLN